MAWGCRAPRERGGEVPVADPTGRDGLVVEGDEMVVMRRLYIELEPVAADLHGARGGVEGVLERGVRVAVVSDTGDGTRGGHSRTVAAVVNSPPAPW